MSERKLLLIISGLVTEAGLTLVRIHQGRHLHIVVRDLATGQERRVVTAVRARSAGEQAHLLRMMLRRVAREMTQGVIGVGHGQTLPATGRNGDIKKGKRSY
jgi:hypothetical protein